MAERLGDQAEISHTTSSISTRARMSLVASCGLPRHDSCRALLLCVRCSSCLIPLPFRSREWGRRRASRPDGSRAGGPGAVAVGVRVRCARQQRLSASAAGGTRTRRTGELARRRSNRQPTVTAVHVGVRERAATPSSSAQSGQERASDSSATRRRRRRPTD